MFFNGKQNINLDIIDVSNKTVLFSKKQNFISIFLCKNSKVVLSVRYKL